MISQNRALAQVKGEVQRQHPYKVGVPPGTITVKLNQNESPFDLPDEIKEAVIEDWKEIAFNRYPSEQPQELIKMIADHIGWDEGGIVVGNGSNELTYTIGVTFISSGRSVVLPRPMFSFYERIVDIFGGTMVSVTPRETLQFDTDGILDAIQRTAPSAVILTSPNNPTGLALPLSEIQVIAEAAPGVVIVDEAYVEFADEPSMITVLHNHPNVILLRTFSKAFGLAGLRLGYLIGDPILMSELMKVRPPFMIDRFSVVAVKQLLRRADLVRDRIARICGETKRLMQALQQIRGIHVLAGQTNFVAFRVSSDSKKIFRELAGSGILIRDMSGYSELDGFLRVTAGVHDENSTFLNALTRLIR